MLILNIIPFQKYWGIQVNNIKVGSASVVSSFDSIVDTGTTLIILDNTIATKLYKSISGAKYNNDAAMWEVPCKSLKSLPDITFSINNKPYTLTPEQYTVPEWEVSVIITTTRSHFIIDADKFTIRVLTGALLTLDNVSLISPVKI
jgi:hypothetical protein